MLKMCISLTISTHQTVIYYHIEYQRSKPWSKNEDMLRTKNNCRSILKVVIIDLIERRELRRNPKRINLSVWAFVTIVISKSEGKRIACKTDVVLTFFYNHVTWIFNRQDKYMLKIYYHMFQRKFMDSQSHNWLRSTMHKLLHMTLKTWLYEIWFKVYVMSCRSGSSVRQMYIYIPGK